MLIFLFILFMAVTLINVLGEFTPLWKQTRYITTPLLMPTIALYIFISREEIYPLLFAALFCGWVGDILLMFRDDKKRCPYFLPGMLIFAAGHILYLTAFISRLLNNRGAVEAITVPIAALIFLGGVTYMVITRKNYGKLLPVTSLYLVLLISLCSVTVLSFYRDFMLTSLFGIAGSLLFIASDSVLSTHQFAKPLRFERPVAMITYIFAQYALAVSLTGTMPHPWW